jgi:hypothetical protein
MMLLPTDRMAGRQADRRVGFFSSTYTDVGLSSYSPGDAGITASQNNRRVDLIHRWRLEKPAGCASACEPVRPIKFYIDPSVPAAWRPFVKIGVELWQPAFLALGYVNTPRAVVISARFATFLFICFFVCLLYVSFLWLSLSHQTRKQENKNNNKIEKNQKNANQPKAANNEQHTTRQLPGDDDFPADYSSGDVRYSSVSFAITASPFAVAQSSVDPRTGEVLDADVLFSQGWVGLFTGMSFYLSVCL